MKRGATVGGRFRVDRLIGEGSTGEVYFARDKGGEPIALKVLRPELAKDAEAVARFERESRIARKMDSPFIAGMRSAGRNRDGLLWIALEHLDGESLADRLRRTPRLSIEVVGPILEDVLRGLEHAHALGVIHRDIKPANIFLSDGSEGPRAKILDFGVSKLLEKGDHTTAQQLTALDETLGSLSFMPPEQIGCSATVDARADLYATGAVAFLALAGALPFTGASPAARSYFKVREEPLRLEKVTGESWPAAIESFMQRTLARDRDRRFANATEAVEAWRRSVAGGGFPRPPAQEAAPDEGFEPTEPG